MERNIFLKEQRQSDTENNPKKIHRGKMKLTETIERLS